MSSLPATHDCAPIAAASSCPAASNGRHMNLSAARSPVSSCRHGHRSARCRPCLLPQVVAARSTPCWRRQSGQPSSQKPPRLSIAGTEAGQRSHRRIAAKLPRKRFIHPAFTGMRAPEPARQPRRLLRSTPVNGYSLCQPRPHTRANAAVGQRSLAPAWASPVRPAGCVAGAPLAPTAGARLRPPRAARRSWDMSGRRCAARDTVQPEPAPPPHWRPGFPRANSVNAHRTQPVQPEATPTTIRRLVRAGLRPAVAMPTPAARRRLPEGRRRHREREPGHPAHSGAGSPGWRQQPSTFPCCQRRKNVLDQFRLPYARQTHSHQAAHWR